MGFLLYGSRMYLTKIPFRKDKFFVFQDEGTGGKFFLHTRYVGEKIEDVILKKQVLVNVLMDKDDVSNSKKKMLILGKYVFMGYGVLKSNNVN